MPKLLRFKDMMPDGMVLPGQDEYVAYRRRKMRRTALESTEVEVDEALNMSQRLARRRLMKKLAPKIKIGRERAKRRMPDMARYKRRAEKAARLLILKKLSKGKSKSELSFARRQELEKRLEKPAVKARIQRLAKRLLKDVRKKEMERRRIKND